MDLYQQLFLSILKISKNQNLNKCLIKGKMEGALSTPA